MIKVLRLYKSLELDSLAHIRKLDTMTEESEVGVGKKRNVQVFELTGRLYIFLFLVLKRAHIRVDKTDQCGAV